MNIPTNLSTKEAKDSFLKTRIDSLSFPNQIKNLLLQNKLITVRSLMNKSNSDFKKELNLNDSDLNIITNIINKLSVSISIQVQILDEQQNISEYNNEIDTLTFSNIDSLNGNKVIEYFSKYFGVEKALLIGLGRKKEIVRMRDIMVYILRKYGALSFPAIGRLIGNRDHTTVIHSFKKTSKELTANKYFENDLNRIIVESKNALEKKIQIEQPLISNLVSLFKQKDEDKTKFAEPVKISERNLKTLELFRQGLTLDSIGKTIGVTKERVRQIIISTLKNNAINDSISTGVDINFTDLFSDEKRKRDLVKKSSKPVKQIKNVKVHEWSRYYDACKTCGTNTTPHFQRGFCENCGNKSIDGDAREKMIKEHKNKCDLCDIPRDQAIKNYHKDFYLSRRGKSVLCRKCFLTTMGKVLANSRKNRWKIFYN